MKSTIIFLILVTLVGCMSIDDQTAENYEKSREMDKIEKPGQFAIEKHGHMMSTFTYNHNGMEFLVFYQSDGYDFAEVEVVNLTKEELEMEYYKEQIQELRGY